MYFYENLNPRIDSLKATQDSLYLYYRVPEYTESDTISGCFALYFSSDTTRIPYCPMLAPEWCLPPVNGIWKLNRRTLPNGGYLLFQIKFGGANFFSNKIKFPVQSETIVDTLTITTVDTLTITETDTVFLTIVDTLTITKRDTIYISETDTIIIPEIDTIFITKMDTVFIEKPPTNGEGKEVNRFWFIALIVFAGFLLAIVIIQQIQIDLDS